MATAYVPVQSQGVAASAVAINYVPGNATANAGSNNGNNAPVMATVYNPNGTAATATAMSFAGAPLPPASAPSYNPNVSFNNGNHNYNTSESTFWECSMCTFPNLRTEATCKGCGGAIPPGLLRPSAHQGSVQYAGGGGGGGASYPPRSTASAASTSYAYDSSSLNQMNSQMTNLSFATSGAVGNTAAAGAGVGGQHNDNNSGGVMRVHIPPGMNPGQKIKVRSPDGKEVIKVIPPRSEWQSDSADGSKPFFRMQFGPSPTAAPIVHANHAPSSNSHNNYHQQQQQYGPVSPFTTQWREFHTRASSAYNPPPLGMRSVPHLPRGAGTGIPPNGRHKALLIGINYTGTRAALKGCINDAKNMQKLLMRNGFPDDGSHMLLLTDERSRGREYQPNSANILKSFHWFMKDLRKGDVLFFHFSGHGGQVPDNSGMEADGFNETIIPLDHDRAGQISDDVLWGSLVYALPEGVRLTALMDMCHSGTGLDLPYDYNVDNRRWTEDMNPAHSVGDVVLFSGCEDAQTSADVQSGYQAGGAMTKAFTEAYQRISMSTYHEFLTMVKNELRKKRFSQRPQLTSSQQFDANSRIFSLGHESSTGTIPSVIEPNHNPQVGRQKRRHVRAGRQGMGRGGGGGANLFNVAAAGVGGALLFDAFFN